MKYRLVAIDLDGTIVDKNGAIMPGARDAVQQLLSRGIIVTLATGRMYQPTNRFAVELNLTAPLICYQGALIRQPRHGEVLWHRPLPSHLAQEIISELRKVNVHRYVYIDGCIYVERSREEDRRYAEVNGAELYLVDDLTVSIDRESPTEIAARGVPEQIELALANIRKHFGCEVIANKVHASFCEIAHVAAGKDNALRYLAELSGIPQQETVAIGDNANDISMLQWAGLGIVVGDALEEVRAAADWVIDNADGDSFCRSITRLLGASGQ